MLKCPDCGRTGGPFRLTRQIQADGQVLRSWSCPCGLTFHAVAGTERTAVAQAPYTGFSLEWGGRAQPVRLERIGKHETIWRLGPWTISVSGPPSGPGTRVVALIDKEDEPAGEWRLDPNWGPGEVGRRLKLRPLPPGLEPDLLARIFVRLLV